MFSMLTPENRAYNDKTFSDVSIHFSEREVYCHKLVLCQASDYFKALCGPDSKFAENVQGAIELCEDDPDAIEVMLQYLYNKPYDKIIEDMKDNGKATGTKLQMGICMVGKKYLMPELEKNGLVGLRSYVAETEATEDAASIFSAYCFLSDHKNHDPAFAEIMLELGKKHLPDLFAFPDFRKMLEEDENKEVLDVAIKGVKRVYEPPATVTVTRSVRRKMECYSCGNEWYTTC